MPKKKITAALAATLKKSKEGGTIEVVLDAKGRIKTFNVHPPKPPIGKRDGTGGNVHPPKPPIGCNP